MTLYRVLQVGCQLQNVNMWAVPGKLKQQFRVIWNNAILSVAFLFCIYKLTTNLTTIAVYHCF